MIDPTRRELLKPIEELSAACPEYRFGQLVLNLAFLGRVRGWCWILSAIALTWLGE